LFIVASAIFLEILADAIQIIQTNKRGSMNSNTDNKIAIYKYHDSKRIAYAIPLGHFFFMLGFFFSENTFAFSNPHFWVCFNVSIFYLFVFVFYEWQNSFFSQFLVFFYALSLFIEFFAFGLPPSLMPFNHTLSKGILLEIFVSLMPFVYLGFRIFLIVPLIQLILNSNRLNSKLCRKTILEKGKL
jgi:hypothetical protein